MAFPVISHGLLIYTFKSLLLLVVFGFFRCSEFTTQSTKFDPLLHPTMSDLPCISEDSLVYTLRQSKPSRAGNQIPVCMLNYTSHTTLVHMSIQVRKMLLLLIPPFQFQTGFKLSPSLFSALEQPWWPLAVKALSHHVIKTTGHWSSLLYQFCIHSYLPDND